MGMNEHDYPAPLSELLTLGKPSDRRHWPDYLSAGFGSEHIPDLIRMAQDEDLHWADSDSTEVWAPVHAWRVLALLHADAAIEPLVDLLDRVDDYDDDWVNEDLPVALGVLGPAAVPALREGLANSDRGLWARVAMTSSLSEIGQKHPKARSACVAALAGQLERFAEMDPILNAFLISALVDLNAKEAAPVIEMAFAANQVDLSVMGDWQDVEIYLERGDYLSRFDHVGPLSGPPAQKPGRNDPCWCGSGIKYKHCHLRVNQNR
jgi:hypothetical protein